MSVDYTTTILTQRLQVVINAIDGGTSNGYMRLLDSGGNILSSLQLSRPMGVAANGVLTFNGLSLIDPAAAAGGYATAARLENGDGTFEVRGLTAGAASPGANYDILLTPSNLLVAGQTVAVTAATITGN